MAAPLFEDPMLLRAFPKSVRADAEVTMRALSRPLQATPSTLIQDTNQQPAGFYPAIYVHGELLQVPYRHYYEWPSKDRTKDLTARQQLILACWMSRNHDGRVRQRALSLVLPSDASWTIPFVIQLCGEYVIEIGFDILDFLKSSLPVRPVMLSEYARFVRNNPEFMSITRQRTVSYWLDYYQHQLRQDQYPQFLAVEALTELAAEPALREQ
jgi:hypothetical protein